MISISTLRVSDFDFRPNQQDSWPAPGRAQPGRSARRFEDNDRREEMCRALPAGSMGEVDPGKVEMDLVFIDRVPAHSCGIILLRRGAAQPGKKSKQQDALIPHGVISNWMNYKGSSREPLTAGDQVVWVRGESK